MRIIGWVVIIGIVLYVWSTSDPSGFQKQKDKVLGSVLQKNNTNSSIPKLDLVLEKTYDEQKKVEYTANIIDFGKPQKIIEFLCIDDTDCKRYVPGAPVNIMCDKETGNCIVK